VDVEQVAGTHEAQSVCAGFEVVDQKNLGYVEFFAQLPGVDEPVQVGGLGAAMLYGAGKGDAQAGRCGFFN
jgi:hypothetical protein